MIHGTARWLVLTWRLPSGSSTPRVTLWRSLRRLGAAVLTPGAAILPFRDDLQEQLDWLAQEVEDQDGDAWVLPVTELTEVEERKVREQMNRDRQAEYEELATDALSFLERAPDHPGPDDAFGPHRMFWGTDITKMPCSWRQCVTMFTEELPWLSEEDKRLIMGEALCAWWGWDRTSRV